jgi:hypothetical protein
VTALGALLLVVGIGDLIPRRFDGYRRWVVIVVELVALGAISAATIARGFELAGLWFALTALAGAAGWFLGSMWAVNSPPEKVRWARTFALTSLGVSVGVLYFFADGVIDVPLIATAPTPLGAGSGSLLLLLGVVVSQLGTANRVVRFVLDEVGVSMPREGEGFKGGRVLGPLERLVIVVLGIAGQLGAAAVVVAAKGLLRYPELRGESDSGPTGLSEYFLIGSFTSWLFGLVGAVLLIS